MFSLKTILQTPATTGSVKGVSAVLSGKYCDQSRSLCRKSKFKPKKVYQWPYKKIPWNYFTMWWDPLTKRKFTENTKLICVDGNVGVGKREVAKRIADEFGLLYMPPNLDLDKLYINKHGFDYRSLNPLLPERLRICDFEMFHENPTRHSVIHLQNFIFKLRVHQYMEALRHIFNTGQGVVMVRSCYTDRAFVEAMHNVGWLPTGYLRADGVRFYDWKMRYNFLRNFLLSMVPKPHLVVYVDTPVDVCMDRIKNHPDPKVRESKALTREFLEEIENAYKDIVLPKCDYNGVVHNMPIDEPFIEDDFQDLFDHIEAADLEPNPDDTRFADWHFKLGGYYYRSRKFYTSIDVASAYNVLAGIPYFDIAGMGDCVTASDLILRQALMERHVGDMGVGHTVEYNADSSIHGWFKAAFGFESLEERLDKCLRADFL